MYLEQLFKKWKANFEFDAFIRDGIVDLSCYENPHVLFILREMNCQVERDLCNDLQKNGSGWKTWNNAARWIIALLDGREEYPKEISRDERASQLSRIAVMNLKKEGGGSRVDGKKLSKAVKEQRELIYEEICYCNPDIIICCGVSSSSVEGNADLLKEHVLPTTAEWRLFQSKNFKRAWWYYFAEINEKKVPVISFCHPQVTNLEGARGHENLFKPLYREMLYIREKFLTGHGNI